MKLSGATVAVTGGAGFIGSHLVRRLVDGGARRVVVLDSLRCGSLEHLRGLPVEVVTGTLGQWSSEQLRALLHGVDALFHLAAEKHTSSSPRRSRLLSTNVHGTLALFEAAVAAGVQKTVFASSLYAYGRMNEPAMREDEAPCPTTLYGLTKLCGERLLQHVSRSGGMRADSLRYFFVYGPRQFAGSGYKSVIVRTFERLAAGQAPVINGDGRQRLDYLFVDDVVDATVRCMESDGTGRVMNVGSGTGVEVGELVRTMMRVAGARGTPQHAPADWTDGSCRFSDTRVVRDALGWAPTVTLEDGLRRTWESL
jgi:UDP-glucose 4-epimerase